MYANQKTLLRQGANGMEFESNKKELVEFKARESLSDELSIPWVNTSAKSALKSPASVAMPAPQLSTSARLSALQQYLSAASTKSNKLKQKQLKQSVKKLAIRLHEDYLKKCQSKPRGLALKLMHLVEDMRDACSQHDDELYER